MFWPLGAIKLQRAQSRELNTVRNALWDGVAVGKRPNPSRSNLIIQTLHIAPWENGHERRV